MDIQNVNPNGTIEYYCINSSEKIANVCTLCRMSKYIEKVNIMASSTLYTHMHMQATE